MAIDTSFDDVFERASRVTRGKGEEFQGYNSPVPPAKSGFAIRSVDPGRLATPVRNMIRWYLPETGIVEMYVNPKNIVYRDKKLIYPQTTKGGFVIQYFGEDLGQMNINGTTGSSGIEGINVLHDIYRNEQLAFDSFALATASNSAEDIINLPNFLQNPADTFLDSASAMLEGGTSNPTRPRPTLAALATSVEMYYSGWVFRGFFTDFTLTEDADSVGLYQYQMNFTYTQKRGYRLNSMPWHRSATSGPSDNSQNGIPLIFNTLAADTTTPTRSTAGPKSGELSSRRPLTGGR